MTEASVLHLVKVIDACDSIITDKYPTAQIMRDPHAMAPLGRAGHLRWMLEESREMVLRAKLDRASQWVGFVQGFLFAEHHVTIQTLQLIDILGYLPENSG